MLFYLEMTFTLLVFNSSVGAIIVSTFQAEVWLRTLGDKTVFPTIRWWTTLMKSHIFLKIQFKYCLHSYVSLTSLKNLIFLHFYFFNTLKICMSFFLVLIVLYRISTFLTSRAQTNQVLMGFATPNLISYIWCKHVGLHFLIPCFIKDLEGEPINTEI